MVQTRARALTKNVQLPSSLTAWEKQQPGALDTPILLGGQKDCTPIWLLWLAH